LCQEKPYWIGEYSSFLLLTAQVILISGILRYLISSRSGNKKVKEGKMATFKDRRDAGRKLAQKLSAYAGRPNMLVLALPRGGVPVAYEVALILSIPLDVFIVRKLGLPGREELAIGAIASGGIRILNADIIRTLSVPDEAVNFVVRRESQELQRREKLYRGDRPPPEVRDRTIILIDDGLATGASMRAAVAGLRAQHPAGIVAAVPAASSEACEVIQSEVDEMICAITPEPFYGVSRWYEDFAQVTDEEVRILLEEANRLWLYG
jgi:predicted phosphoribosyltransferase